MKWQILVSTLGQVDIGADFASVLAVSPALAIRSSAGRVGDFKLTRQIAGHAGRHINWIIQTSTWNRTVPSCTAKPRTNRHSCWVGVERCDSSLSGGDAARG
jgi:hypothetical protein